MNKTENSEDRRRRKRAGNGGKGRENGGKGRTLKIEVQILPETCPQGVIKLQSNWPNGDVRQRLKCATMNTYLLYCRVCFLHCCSGGVYYIGKSWEILSSMCGCLSGVWSLVVSFATAKVAMGSPIAFVNSCVWGAFLLSRGVFNSPEAKGNSCGVIVLPRGPEALSFASGVSICVSVPVLHVFMSNCVCLIFILRCFDVMVTLQELQAWHRLRRTAAHHRGAPFISWCEGHGSRPPGTRWEPWKPSMRKSWRKSQICSVYLKDMMCDI